MTALDFDPDLVRDGIAAGVGGAMVINYAVVAEVVDGDGEATIQTITDCDHAWQVLGMLHHALLITKQTKYGLGDDE